MTTNKDALRIIAKSSINPKEIANAQNKVKEEKKMKKFEINGIEYRYNEETGRYSKIEDGKTKRIGKAEYEKAASIPTDVKKIPSENGEHVVEFAKMGADYGVRTDGEENFIPMSRDEVKMEVDKREGGMKFYAAFEFMGRKYWVKDAITKDTKTKKTTKRRPKDIAYENKELGVTLTAKQLDFCKHLPDTSFWDNGLDSCPWCDVLAEEIGGQFAGKPMTVGAMISTLREKGLVNVERDMDRKGKPKFMVLTDLGKAVAKELGLK